MTSLDCRNSNSVPKNSNARALCVLLAPDDAIAKNGSSKCLLILRINLHPVLRTTRRTGQCQILNMPLLLVQLLHQIAIKTITAMQTQLL